MQPAPFAEKIGTLVTFLDWVLALFILFVSDLLVNDWLLVLRPQPTRPSLFELFISSPGCWGSSLVVVFSPGGGENPQESGCMGS